MFTNKQKSLAELRSAAFHLRKVIVMVQKKKNCLDIIRESQIVGQILEKANSHIRARHLEKCVGNMLENQGKDRQIREIMLVLKKR